MLWELLETGLERRLWKYARPSYGLSKCYTMSAPSMSCTNTCNLAAVFVINYEECHCVAPEEIFHCHHGFCTNCAVKHFCGAGINPKHNATYYDPKDKVPDAPEGTTNHLIELMKHELYPWQK